MSNIFRRSTQSKASKHSRRQTADDEGEDEEKALMRKLYAQDFDSKRHKIRPNWSVIVGSEEDGSGRQRLGSILSVGANPVELLTSFKDRHGRDVYFWTPNPEWQKNFGCKVSMTAISIIGSHLGQIANDASESNPSRQGS